jgi:hypothetical protein
MKPSSSTSYLTTLEHWNAAYAPNYKVAYPMGYIPKIQEYSDALADAAADGNIRAIGRAKASLDYFYDCEVMRRRGQLDLLEQGQW